MASASCAQSSISSTCGQEAGRGWRCRRLRLMPPGMAPVPWIFLPAVASMISCPNLRIRTARRPSSGFSRITSKMLRLLGRRLEAEQQVGRGEVEEMQHMALHHLPVMHQPPHLLRRGRQHVDADDLVHRLGAGQMVADRADAAQPLHDHRHFPQKPPADEALEAAELDDMQPRLVHLVVARRGEWSPCHGPRHGSPGEISIRRGLGHARGSLCQSKRRVARSKPGSLPSSSGDQRVDR